MVRAAEAKVNLGRDDKGNNRAILYFSSRRFLVNVPVYFVSVRFASLNYYLVTSYATLLLLIGFKN